MRSPNHIAIASFVSLLLLAAPARAQEEPDGPAEVARLEALLQQLDEACARLRSLVDPRLDYTEHDLRQLLFRPEDRAAPSLTIPSPSAGYRTGAGAPTGGGVGGALCFEEEEAETGLGVDADMIVELLEGAVGEEDEEGSLELSGGFLMARKSKVAQARIAQLLDELRRASLHTLQLEVGFYRLSPALQLEVELAARQAKGALSPALLAKLDARVAAGEEHLAGSALLTALNGQRVFLHQGEERAYVAGFNQMAGGTGQQIVTVADPVVEVLRTGLALDLRASVVGGDEPEVAMDVRFMRTRPLESVQRSTPWGALDVPRVTVDSVRTQARVAPGGGMLVFAAQSSGDDDRPAVTILVRPKLVR